VKTQKKVNLATQHHHHQLLNLHHHHHHHHHNPNLLLIVVEVASFLRDSMAFDHAESVAGTDYPKDNQIEVVYHLGSYSRMDLGAHILLLATRTNREDARLPTLINIYKSVEYHERETFEMLGVYFEGHPRNERFLLPEDWADIPPLRKDFRIKGR
jgi:NADH-quinone oxidoreductase subunit C